MCKVSKKRFGAIVAGITMAATLVSSANAAIVYSVDFDSATSDGTIQGVTGGTATIATTSNRTTIETSPTFGPEGNRFLRTISPVNNAQNPQAVQVANLAPSAGNSLSVLTTQIGGQRVMKGGFDFFLRSDIAVNGTTTSVNTLRVIDAGSSSGNGARLIVNSDSGSQDTALQVDVITSGGALKVRAPEAFTIAANTLYHVAVLYTNDGAAGNTTGHLFIVEGNTAIDTSDLTSSNPALRGTTSINFTNEASSFSVPNFNFGKVNTTSNERLQDFDAFRLYDATPSTFAAITAVPEPTVVALAGVGLAMLALRRRPNA
ncbi:MAG TPA: PEP-CTERM sorting domain-containing protein [Tepidisphaeraceae bacterium]|jgi:hypothetical protein|nr:PEP-CTERM sorting domain-containing protein [Tepidisphaeraceae bacterium]